MKDLCLNLNCSAPKAKYKKCSFSPVRPHFMFKFTNRSPNCELKFICSTNAAKHHSFGDKDLQVRFPVLVLRQDNLKIKRAPEPSFLKN